jgi:hypothetical protein
MINKNVFIVSAIVLAVLSRFLPHPPNFTPIAAIGLLAAQGFGNRWFTFMIPIISLFLSDLVLGLHATIPFVYLSFIMIVTLGLLVKKVNFTTVLSASVIFFLVSNFGVWLIYYPKSIAGFLECYALALPFFLNTLMGDLVYAALLIYPFYVLQNKRMLSF